MKNLLFAVFGMLLMLLPCEARAQCYNGNYSHSYHQPTYQHNYVTTYKEVLIPLFTPYPVFVDPRFSYHYTSGNYLGVALAPNVAVPTAVVQQPAVSQPAMPAKGSLSIDEAVEKAVEKMLKKLQAAVPQAYEPDGPPPVPGAVSYNEQARPAKNIAQVLQAHCALCHTGGKAKGDFIIFASPGRLSPAFDAQAALEAIEDGRMPPRERPRMPDSDRGVVRQHLGL